MSDPLAKPNALIGWLKENGGHFHSSTKLQIDPQTGLSVYSTSPIKPDERLVSCPFELAITAQSASRSVSSLKNISEDDLVWPAGSSREGEKWNERMRIGAYLGLHWVHQDRSEEQWPSELNHKTYLDSLPTPAELATPLYFTESELELLNGSNLLGAVADRKKEWKAESEAVRAVLKEEGLTWDRYLTVATYMSSRSFPSKLLKLPENGSDAKHSAEKENDEVSQPVLLPGVDIFNHARGQPILWLSSQTTSSSGSSVPSISLVTTQSSEGDIQLFNNYGAKPNEELLMGYGFVLPSNPDDIVNLRLGTANLPPHVTKKLSSKGLDAAKRFELRRDGEIDKELLEVVRIMLGEEGHAHDHDGSCGHDHDHDDADEDDEHAMHQQEEKEMALEMDVLGMLGGMLDDKLEKLQENGSEGAEAKDVREDIRKMCEIYKQGQVDILNAAMDKLSERIERIEKLLDEGMGGCPCGC